MPMILTGNTHICQLISDVTCCICLAHVCWWILKVGGMDCVNEPLTCIMNLIMISAFLVFSSFEIIMEFICFRCQSVVQDAYCSGCLVAFSISSQNSQEEIKRYFY